MNGESVSEREETGGTTPGQRSRAGSRVSGTGEEERQETLEHPAMKTP